MQSSVKTVLHITSATKLDYNMRKKHVGYECNAGRKEYVWTLTLCTDFLHMINLCIIMRDSKHRAITQTIHTNLVDLFCDAG